MESDNSVIRSVKELLELTALSSPFTKSLVEDYRRRLVDRLRENGKIDDQTADYLLN